MTFLHLLVIGPIGLSVIRSPYSVILEFYKVAQLLYKLESFFHTRLADVVAGQQDNGKDDEG